MALMSVKNLLKVPGHHWTRNMPLDLKKKPLARFFLKFGMKPLFYRRKHLKLSYTSVVQNIKAVALRTFNKLNAPSPSEESMI